MLLLEKNLDLILLMIEIVLSTFRLETIHFSYFVLASLSTLVFYSQTIHCLQRIIFIL